MSKAFAEKVIKKLFDSVNQKAQEHQKLLTTPERQTLTTLYEHVASDLQINSSTRIDEQFFTKLGKELETHVFAVEQRKEQIADTINKELTALKESENELDKLLERKDQIIRIMSRIGKSSNAASIFSQLYSLKAHIHNTKLKTHLSEMEESLRTWNKKKLLYHLAKEQEALEHLSPELTELIIRVFTTFPKQKNIMKATAQAGSRRGRSPSKVIVLLFAAIAAIISGCAGIAHQDYPGTQSPTQHASEDTNEEKWKKDRKLDTNEEKWKKDRRLEEFITLLEGPIEDIQTTQEGFTYSNGRIKIAFQTLLKKYGHRPSVVRSIVQKILPLVAARSDRESIISQDCRSLFYNTDLDELKQDYGGKGLAELIPLYEQLKRVNPQINITSDIRLVKYLAGELTFEDILEDDNVAFLYLHFNSLYDESNMQQRKRLIMWAWKQTFEALKAGRHPILHSQMTESLSYLRYTESELQNLRDQVRMLNIEPSLDWDTVLSRQSISTIIELGSRGTFYFQSVEFTPLLKALPQLTKSEQEEFCTAFLEHANSGEVVHILLSNAYIFHQIDRAALGHVVTKTRERLRPGSYMYDEMIFKLNAFEQIKNAEELARLVTTIEEAKMLLDAMGHYIHDTRIRKSGAYWKSWPEFVRDKFQGDCEDASIAIAAMLHDNAGYGAHLLRVNFEESAHALYINYRGGKWECGGVNAVDFISGKETMAEVIEAIEAAFSARVVSYHFYNLVDPRVREHFDFLGQRGGDVFQLMMHDFAIDEHAVRGE